jgi:hypothetical protein
MHEKTKLEELKRLAGGYRNNSRDMGLGMGTSTVQTALAFLYLI